MTRDLSRLLCPQSIAVIGGGIWAENVIRTVRAAGFAGPLRAVHPTRERIGGVACVRSVAELPEAPDAAYVCVNRHATIEAVAELARRGAGGAVCFASGFAEARAEDAGAPDLQRRLVAAAGDMPVLGPNCYGFLNYLDGVALWPDQHGGRPVPRGVALVVQSSNLAINLTMQRRGLPLACVVTAGNQAQTGLAEIGAALIDDPRITALGLHVEGVGDLAAFEALACKAHDQGKPVVVLKAGRSEAAQAATVSHTASLAGSHAGAQALFRRLGFAMVDTPATLLEALKLLHVTGPLANPAIAALSCSGGEAGLVADLAEATGVTFPPLSPAQESRLRAALGPLVRLSNPLDYHTFVWGDVDAMAQAFAAMTGPDIALSMVIADFPRADRCDPAAWDCVLEAVARAAEGTGRPFAIAATLPENMPEALADRLIAQGIAPLSGLAEALAAIRAAHQAACPPDPAPVAKPRIPRSPRLWSEDRAKAALAAHGLPVPPARRVDGAEGLAGACEAVGFPVVLKALGLAHKSDRGGVALNLQSVAEVEDAARTMPGQAFLVERMVPGAVAELLVGIVPDPAHGFVLTLGAGGVMTELLDDTASLLLPVTAAQVEAALAGLGIGRVLRGWRGRPPADMAALVRAVLAVQDFVLHHRGRIAEVEVNPLLALPQGAVAVDALIRAED